MNSNTSRHLVCRALPHQAFPRVHMCRQSVLWDMMHSLYGGVQQRFFCSHTMGARSPRMHGRSLSPDVPFYVRTPSAPKYAASYRNSSTVRDCPQMVWPTVLCGRSISRTHPFPASGVLHAVRILSHGGRMRSSGWLMKRISPWQAHRTCLATPVNPARQRVHRAGVLNFLVAGSARKFESLDVQAQASHAHGRAADRPERRAVGRPAASGARDGASAREKWCIGTCCILMSSSCLCAFPRPFLFSVSFNILPRSESLLLRTNLLSIMRVHGLRAVRVRCRGSSPRPARRSS